MKWGDACNLGTADLDVFRHKLGVLRQHCEDVGRNYDEIVRSTSIQVHLLDEGADPEQATAQVRGRQSYGDYAKGTIVGTPDAVTERLQTLIDAGVTYFITYFPRVAYDMGQMQRFAEEIIPRFQ